MVWVSYFTLFLKPWIWKNISSWDVPTNVNVADYNSKIDIYMGNKLSLGFWLGLAGLLREYPIKILFYPLAPFISQTGTTGSVPSNYPRDRQYYFMMTLLVLSPRAMSSQWLPILASLFPQIKPTKRPGREERRHQNQRISKRRYCYTQERERWDILPYS